MADKHTRRSGVASAEPSNPRQFGVIDLFTLEFFERGIAQGGWMFVPWPRVDVRPSQNFADRMVVVIRPAVDSVVGETKMDLVTESLRQEVFDAAAAEVVGKLNVG